MAATLVVDLELKKAFQDLQIQTLATREKVLQIKNDIEQATRSNGILKLVESTLGSLQSEHNTYESVGRVFVLRDRDTIKSSLNERIEQNNEKIKVLEQNRVYQETKVKESENSIRELINQKKNATK